jgi:hypothetical protein
LPFEVTEIPEGRFHQSRMGLLEHDVSGNGDHLSACPVDLASYIFEHVGPASVEDDTSPMLGKKTCRCPSNAG